ncbi:bacterial regulatory, tetR family protein [Rhodococcus sp. MTM3W5.2]|nr:bacterial regulatory, tetR family protein [Rhodococcus sp. MTM3W5.2]
MDTSGADNAGAGDLPRAVKLAWGLAEPGSRGPRRGLSIERILDTAIEIADTEGAASLSMARLAKELGFTTMSLYRYVKSKDELIELISDRVVGPAPHIEPGTPWREALAQWATSEYEALMRHPWWLQLSLGECHRPDPTTWRGWRPDSAAWPTPRCRSRCVSRSSSTPRST